ncbi:MAG: hypothetical protein JNL58_31710 [Planctomyces sp.]|nr:hypothetical protein [Planctomyces sp.]
MKTFVTFVVFSIACVPLTHAQDVDQSDDILSSRNLQSDVHLQLPSDSAKLADTFESLRQQTQSILRLTELAGVSHGQVIEFTAMRIVPTVIAANDEELARRLHRNHSAPAETSAVCQLSHQQVLAEAELGVKTQETRSKIRQLSEHIAANLLRTSDSATLAASPDLSNLTSALQCDESECNRLEFLSRSIPSEFAFTTTINPQLVRLRMLHAETVALYEQLSPTSLHLRKQLGVLRYQRTSANRDLAILATMAVSSEVSQEDDPEGLLLQRSQIGDLLAWIESEIQRLESLLSSGKTISQVSWSMKAFGAEATHTTSQDPQR